VNGEHRIDLKEGAHQVSVPQYQLALKESAAMQTIARVANYCTWNCPDCLVSI
jgi:hypothetical protein